MIRRYSIPCLATVLTVVIAGFLSTGWSASWDRDIPTGKLKWGVLLQSDEAFYEVGESARVLHAVYNFTDVDVIAYVWRFGPNGCSYRITVENAEDQVVWEPYIVPCPANPSAPVTLHAGGGRLAAADSIPLVYHNSEGIGIEGDPLPPGFYTIGLEVRFDAPHADSGTYGGGLVHSASVPVQIVP